MPASTSLGALSSAAVGTVTSPSRRGSWWGLVLILREARLPQQVREEACPNDGEPYQTSVTGVRFCPWAGYKPGGR